MDTKAKLSEAMKAAMKSGDEVRKRTVRMALAAVKQAEVDKRSNPADKRSNPADKRSNPADKRSNPADKRAELDELAINALIQKEVKTRREALEEAKKASRDDLVSANEAEIKVLEEFLPKAMPAEELRTLVQAAITETGASAPGDMGRVMKVVIPRVAGRAPNDAVSAAVKELLTK